MGNFDDTKLVIDMSEDDQFEIERERLNELAMQCIQSGEKLSNSPMVFRQARIVDELVINKKRLEEIEKTLEAEESGTSNDE